MKVIFNNCWIVLLICFGVTQLAAQELTQADLVKTADELIEANLSGNGNEAYLTQIGNKNEVSITQELQGNSATNLVKVLQVGNRNNGQINQLGVQNQTVLIQNGRRNEYSLNLEGSENTFVIIQEGKDNVINQNLTNTSKTYIELIQKGNENEITHNQDGLNTKNIVVKQIGDGMKAHIIQTSN